MVTPSKITGFAEPTHGYGVSYLVLVKYGDGTIALWENDDHRDDLDLKNDEESLGRFEAEYGPLYESLDDYRWAITNDVQVADLEEWWLNG